MKPETTKTPPVQKMEELARAALKELYDLPPNNRVSETVRDIDDAGIFLTKWFCRAFIEGRNYVANKTETTNWLPTESLPKDGKRFLARLDEHQDIVIVHYEQVDFQDDGENYVPDNWITGWMPLPEWN